MNSLYLSSPVPELVEGWPLSLPKGPFPSILGTILLFANPNRLRHETFSLQNHSVLQQALLLLYTSSFNTSGGR